MHLVLFILFLSLAALVAADLSNLNVTAECKTALETTLQNPNISTCLNALGLEDIINLSANTSIVTAVTNFAWPFCAQSPCEPYVLSAAESNISSSCANEITPVASEVGLIGVDYILQWALQEFSVAKEVVCLEDAANNNTNCIVELLTNLQTQLGQPLTLEGLGTVYQNILKGNLPNVNVSALACSPCAQALYDIVQPGKVVKGLFEVECGSAFVTASPSGIPETTGTAAQALVSPPPSSGGVRLNAVSIGGVAFAAVSFIGFAILF